MKDVYLKFGNPNIKGESQDKEHADWIEIAEWRSMIIQPRSATASTAGGHTSERTEHMPMIFIKDMDVSSPLLYQHVSGGTTFDEVTVEFYRANNNSERIRYMTVRLLDVLISDIKIGTDGEGLPFEVFALKYAAVQWTYTQQSIAGTVTGSTQGAWSLTKNDKTYSV